MKLSRRSRNAILTIAVLAAVAGIGYFWVTPRILLSRQRFVTRELLESADPNERARGAWRLIDHRDPALMPRLVQLVMGDERDPNVREACVYTLGRLEDPAGASAILYAIDLDDTGFVRSAAWLALARLSEKQFRDRATGRAASTDPWDQIGIAYGLLERGDATMADRLLHWAANGDEGQRSAASQALTKRVQPLLEVAGRWPLDPRMTPGEPWPPEFVAEITRRAAPLDLDVIAHSTQEQVRRAEGLRSNLRRITSARERIARWLNRE